MPGAYTAVDLSLLPAPAVVEALAYEDILAAMLADLRLRDPVFSALTESDPAYKLLEVCAFRELLLRQRVNDAARSVMLAFASGTDLDHIAATYGVARLVIDAGDPAASPPVPAVHETDADLRTRVLLSLEGYTTAGSVGSYQFHALSAAADVKDAAVASPPLSPGQVHVAILSRTGTGAASAALINTVSAALSADDVRPLCDTVNVSSVTVVTYTITATLTLMPGAGQEAVLEASKAAARAYIADQHRIGRDITRSGVYAALHQPGVQNVSLTAPAADLLIAWNQVPWCAALAVTVSGTAE